VRHLESVRRPLEIPEEGMLTDLLWADPCPDHEYYRESDRGTSFTFGADVAHVFLRIHDFDLIVRAHQVVSPGFEFPFKPEMSVLTLFSAPDYCEQYGNLGALMMVNEDLKCSFEFLAPPAKPDPPRFRPPTPQVRA
jgi:serine/threonine-protein phosphatase PP1 catalytic subunit